MVSYLGKPTRIRFLVKCDPFSMEYGLEVFTNRDVDYINVRREPYYYSVLTITLLSAKKKMKSLVMKSLRKSKAMVGTRNDSKNL